MPEHNFTAFLLIENVGNLLNDDWGVFKQQGFPRALQLVDFDIENDQYVYNSFFTPAPQGREADASLWEVRFGVSYEF